jgi:hypothetical protein
VRTGRTARRGARAPLLGTLGLGLLGALAGCGAHANSQRAQVAAYVSRVNRIESALARPLATVSRVSVRVSDRRSAPAGVGVGESERQLTQALDQIRAQEERLSALPPPPSAARLRTLLLRLSSDEAHLTAQLKLLIVFPPRFAAVVAPLGPALRQLERALSVRQAPGAAAVSAVYAAKANALRHFQAITAMIVSRLRRLTPPDASKPGYRAQLRSLREMGASAGRLAGALASGAPGDVRPLLVDFDRAALATRTLPVQKAQIAAIRAYDAQTRRLSTLSAEVARERLRLVRSLG